MPPKSPKKKPVAKKAKAAKKTKDPNKPKRVMSSYMYWMTKEGREAAKKSLGAGASIGEIAKEAGKVWGTYSDKDKEKWKQAAIKNHKP
ncbi:hypothetical protein TrLO_g3620 [Triparma laevis f. longispina]|uniref:HMG box domain-containing protein n=1 Tax=Triparma laevis f. longispina TaxID=1714387 RepID=A0A9W7F1Y3_9STRA|nr:hypothetical protein TrLO_g3620 [Triparma laevis f. longispina]